MEALRGCGLLVLFGFAVFLSACDLENKQVVLTGELSSYIADDFEGQRSWQGFSLHAADGKMYEVDFSPDQSPGSSPVLIEVRGTLTGDRIEAESFVIQGPVVPESAPSAFGAPDRPRRLLFMLVSFTDTPDDHPDRSVTVDQVRKWIFDDRDSFRKYWLETSFGNLDLEPDDRDSTTQGSDVVDWYELDIPGGNCNWGSFMNEALKIATSHGIVPDEYDAIGVAWPRLATCGYDGVANEGPGAAQRFGFNGDLAQGLPYWVYLLAHEWGHLLGLGHARLLHCTDPTGKQISIANYSCTTEEYGDPFDPMGGFLAGFETQISPATTVYPRGMHYQAENKERVPRLSPLSPWLDKDQNIRTLEHTGDVSSTLISLAPVEYATNDVQLLRIIGPRWTYFVESRAPSDYFENFPASAPLAKGILIRRDEGFWLLGSGSKTDLIDAHPETSSKGDAVLLPGEAFEDPLQGIRVFLQAGPEEGVSPSQMRKLVRVTFSESNCVRRTVSGVPSHLGTVIGSLAPWPDYDFEKFEVATFLITNHDSEACLDSAFSAMESNTRPIPRSFGIYSQRPAVLWSGEQGPLTIWMDYNSGPGIYETPFQVKNHAGGDPVESSVTYILPNISLLTEDIPDEVVMAGSQEVLFGTFNIAAGDAPWSINRVVVVSDSPGASEKVENLKLNWIERTEWPPSAPILVGSASRLWRQADGRARVKIVLQGGGLNVNWDQLQLVGDVPRSASSGELRLGIEAIDTSPQLAEFPIYGSPRTLQSGADF